MTNRSNQSFQGESIEKSLFEYLISNGVSIRQSFVEAGIDEQIMGWDYVTPAGTTIGQMMNDPTNTNIKRIELKYQPQATSYGTFNVEHIMINNNNGTHCKSWYHDKPNQNICVTDYWWVIDDNTMIQIPRGVLQYVCDPLINYYQNGSVETSGFPLCERYMHIRKFQPDGHKYKHTGLSRRASLSSAAYGKQGGAVLLRIPIEYVLTLPHVKVFDIGYNVSKNQKRVTVTYLGPKIYQPT